MHVTTPLRALDAAWKVGCRPNYSHPKVHKAFAVVNGDDISSNTTEGILRRLKTWIRRHDIGGKNREPVVLTVMGEKCLVLTPIKRTYHLVHGFPEGWIQNFDVKLWSEGVEYESRVLDMRTMLWEINPKMGRDFEYELF